MTRSTVGRVVVAAIAALSAQPAAASEFPSWDITTACQGFTPMSHCLETEARARRLVGASWPLLPDAVQKACLDELSSPADHSYRSLSECATRVLRSGPPEPPAKSTSAPGQSETKKANSAEKSEPVDQGATPRSDTDSALQKLLEERASWGTRPSSSRQEDTANKPGSSSIQHALDRLLAERASWGTAPSPNGR